MNTVSQKKTVVGYQVGALMNGAIVNVQGDAGYDRYPSFTILSGDMAAQWIPELDLASPSRRHVLVPIFEGDIEEPTFEPTRSEDDEQYRAKATEEWASDDIEIDAAARVSISDDGAFVAAWVWVQHPSDI